MWRPVCLAYSMGVKVLAIDYGERYVGVAVTDDDGRLALRLRTLDRRQLEVLAGVRDIVAAEKVKVVVVGVPLGMDGEETGQTHASLAFIERLQEVLGPAVAVEGVDERLTSKEAARRVRAEGGRPDDEHAEAARLMLETYLKK